MRANLVTAAVEGCLLGFRSGYAGTCRAKYDAKASSQILVFSLAKSVASKKPPSAKVNTAPVCSEQPTAPMRKQWMAGVCRHGPTPPGPGCPALEAGQGHAVQFSLLRCVFYCVALLAYLVAPCGRGAQLGERWPRHGMDGWIGFRCVSFFVLALGSRYMNGVLFFLKRVSL